MKRDIERERYLKAFGETIRFLRTAADLTQGELATRAGLTQASMSRFEMGMTCPDVLEFRRLALALGKPPPEMYAFVELMFEGSEIPAPGGANGKQTPEPMRKWRTKYGVVVIERDRVIDNDTVKIAAYRLDGGWHGWLSLERLKAAR